MTFQNKEPHISSLQPSKIHSRIENHRASSNNTSSFVDGPLEDTLREISKQQNQKKIHLQDMVMSRTDWFSFLKATYQSIQRLQTQSSCSSDVNEEGSGADKENQYKTVGKDTLIKVIEYNADKIPLKTLESYLGGKDLASSRTHRREKWLS